MFWPIEKRGARPQRSPPWAFDPIARPGDEDVVSRPALQLQPPLERKRVDAVLVRMGDEQTRQGCPLKAAGESGGSICNGQAR
jgi:hypothetical protein